MLETWSIVLTPNEVLGVEAVLKNEDRDEPMPNAKSLLLKIGSAFLDQQANPDKSGHQIAIAFTEAELWLLRDKVSTSLRIGNDLVGLSLKQKIYAGLLAFDTDRQAPAYPVDPSAEDRGAGDEGLQRWREQTKATPDDGRKGGDDDHA